MRARGQTAQGSPGPLVSGLRCSETRREHPRAPFPSPLLSGRPAPQNTQPSSLKLAVLPGSPAGRVLPDHLAQPEAADRWPLLSRCPPGATVAGQPTYRSGRARIPAHWAPRCQRGLWTCLRSRLNAGISQLPPSQRHSQPLARLHFLPCIFFMPE